MEMTLTVDGYMISVSAHNGNVVFYIKDNGNCDCVEIALTQKMAVSLSAGIAAAAEEVFQ